MNNNNNNNNNNYDNNNSSKQHRQKQQHQHHNELRQQHRSYMYEYLLYSIIHITYVYIYDCARKHFSLTHA